jgi:hypothetical protein
MKLATIIIALAFVATTGPARTGSHELNESARNSSMILTERPFWPM